MKFTVYAPEKNEKRSHGARDRTTYLIMAEPTSRKDVPSKAVRMRNTKNAARFGASAVPMLLARKPTPVTIVI